MCTNASSDILPHFVHCLTRNRFFQRLSKHWKGMSIYTSPRSAGANCFP